MQTRLTTVNGLKRVLGTASLVAFGLAYLVPLTVFTTFGSASLLTAGHVPMAYLVTTAAMLFTALSYAALVRALPSAGSAFAYTTEAFGVRTGSVAGWTLLLDYILLPAINFLIIGLYLHAQFPEVPVAAFVLVAIFLVTLLNIIGIEVVGRASFALVVAQLLFAATFVSLALRHAEVTTLAPFYSDGMSWSGILAGAAVLCLSFLGFDAVSTLSEEAADPKRTLPRAILLTTLVGGLIFILVAYASALVLPDWTAIKAADSAGMEVVSPLGGTAIIGFFLTTYIGGCVASALAGQASVARILYAMGRDNILPARVFGALSERFRTPVGATLAVAAVSMIALFTTLDTLVSVISFGALFTFSIVNLSVIKIFLIDHCERGGLALLRYGLCPATGFALTAWLWFSLSRHALLLGLAWLAVGCIYLTARELTAIKKARFSID